MLGTWPEGDVEESVESFPLFSIDCEMVKTLVGYELARVSIINEDLVCIYNTLVKPVNPVLDYLTRYSGVDEELLRDIQVSLKDVQSKLEELLPSKCILIGHSLENDLMALKLYHPYIIDTSLLFAPNATPRSKPSLKMVVKTLLNKIIQAGTNGHDPTEDAMSCMALVKKKLIDGSLCNIQWNENKKTWLPFYLSSSHSINAVVIDKLSLTSLYTQRSETNSRVVTSDDEAAVKAIETIPNSQFVFVQFHAMEHREKKEQIMITSTLSTLDKLSCHVIDSCPKGTLVFVVLGSSHVKEVRELQRAPNTSHMTLKKAVMNAREGGVFAFWR